MKKLLLSAMSFCLLGGAIAQVPNAGFENWKTDTSKLDLSALLPGFVPDTFNFEDPIDWTSVNYITGSDTFTPGVPGGAVMVTKSTSAHTGSSAARIETQNITIPVLGIPVAIPGFVISGEFSIDITNLAGGGGFNPTSLPGSGIPISGRLDSFSVWANYTPVVGDSALLLAVLRKGTNVVATAAGFVNSTTNGYKRFSIPFVYSSCDAPDSLTYAFSSSNLFELQNLAASLGSSTLQPGSVLLVDDVDYSVAPGNYVLNPIANQDDTSVLKNNSLTVDVLANDLDCDGAATLSLGNISTTTAHGTAAKSGNNITYTPDNNYVGLDTVFYTLSSSTGKTSQSLLIINVLDNTGIKDVNLVAVKAFPNPTSNTLNIVANLENATVLVYDLAGRVAATANNFSNNIALDITSLSNGTYFINLLNEQGAIVGKTKFAVAK